MEDVKNNDKLLNSSFDKMNDININYDDELLINTLKNMDLSKASYKNYEYEMTRFLKCNNISFNDLITTITEQQHDTIKDNRIIKYDPQNSLLKNYYDNYINECRNNGNKETSIQTKIRTITAILNYCNIITPSISFKIANSQQKTPLLSNDDITYIINNNCTIHHKAIITFMASTGIRRADTQRFKIIDFLKATYKYHKTLDLDEFLNKYQNNMVGYWDFIPHKTMKSGLPCKVCNSGESSNYIVESLKDRKIAIENYNKRNETNINLSNDMPLFSSKMSCYTEPLQVKSMSKMTSRKNKLFKEYKIISLKEDLENDKITINEYDKLINNLPKFNLHNLRHYFISVLRHYTVNRDIALLMEAHTSDIKTDKYYIGENEELFNEETIRETYESIEEYLTFNNNISISETNKLKKDYDILTAENERLLNENISLKNNYDELRTEQYNFNKELLEVKEMLENSPISKLMEQVGK